MIENIVNQTINIFFIWLKLYLSNILKDSIIKKIIKMIFITLWYELNGFWLKKIFIDNEIKKKNSNKTILFLKKNLFSLKFIKKLIEDKTIKEFITVLPKIKLNGKNDKIIKKNLSLFSMFKILFLK